MENTNKALSEGRKRYNKKRSKSYRKKVRNKENIECKARKRCLPEEKPPDPILNLHQWPIANESADFNSPKELQTQHEGQAGDAKKLKILGMDNELPGSRRGSMDGNMDMDILEDHEGSILETNIQADGCIAYGKHALHSRNILEGLPSSPSPLKAVSLPPSDLEENSTSPEHADSDEAVVAPCLEALSSLPCGSGVHLCKSKVLETSYSDIDFHVDKESTESTYTKDLPQHGIDNQVIDMAEQKIHTASYTGVERFWDSMSLKSGTDRSLIVEMKDAYRSYLHTKHKSISFEDFKSLTQQVKAKTTHEASAPSPPTINNNSRTNIHPSHVSGTRPSHPSSHPCKTSVTSVTSPTNTECITCNTRQSLAKTVESFWMNYYTIHTNIAPIEFCTSETEAIDYFLQHHPHFKDSPRENLKLEFNKFTQKLVPGIRRFKPSSQATHYYNAVCNQPCPDETALQSRVHFSLLNTRGLITNGHSKCKTISDIIIQPSAQHIIAITETFLTKDIGKAEVLKYFPMYTLRRGDRNTDIGRKTCQGGVLLLTSPDIISVKLDSFSNGACEALVTNHPSLDMTIITVYRPPDTTNEEFSELIGFIDSQLSKSPSSHLVLTGDFNFPKDVVLWRDSTDGLVPIPDSKGSNRKTQLIQLLEITDKYYMQQTINIPTRNGPPPNTLDLLFSNNTDLFHSPESIDMSGTSDHNLININTDITVEIPPPTINKLSMTGMQAFRFERANQEAMSRALARKNLCDLVRQAKDPIEAKQVLVDAFIEAAEEAEVPKRRPTSKMDHSLAIRTLYKSRVAILRKLRSRKLASSEHTELTRQLSELQVHRWLRLIDVRHWRKK